MNENNDLVNTDQVNVETPTENTQEVKEINPLYQLDSYENMSTEDLFKTAQKLIKAEPVQSIKKQIDSIKTLLFNALAEERKEKLAAFIEAGNVEMDFEYIQPLKDQFKGLLDEYKTKKDKYYSQLEEQYKENLKLRNGLIEELKSLINTEETLSTTFEHFRNIQEKWRNVGPVAKADSSEVYRTYHHHVENFYDYVQINRELRDLDFQKNLEQKNELIAQAEALIELPINTAFKKLQRLHKVWKEQTGPVVKEMREEVWNRFSEATKKIHDKRHEYINKQKEKQVENLKAKEAICEMIEQIDTKAIKSSNDWKALDAQLDTINQDWKKIGYAPEGDNDTVWERYKAALKEIRQEKNLFYKDLKKGFSEAISQLQTIVDEAEALKDSTEWKDTANQLKHLQSKWKSVKGAPRKDADALWVKFRAACNHFFDALQAHHEAKDKEFEANIEAKKAYLESALKAEIPSDAKEAIQYFKKLQGEWKNLGRIPASQKAIDDEFRAFINKGFDQLSLNRAETEKLKIQAKIEQWNTEGNADAIAKEQQFIRNKINDLKAELAQLEANIQLFTTSGNKKNPLIASVEKNIEKLRKDVEFHKEQLLWIKEFSK